MLLQLINSPLFLLKIVYYNSQIMSLQYPFRLRGNQGYNIHLIVLFKYALNFIVSIWVQGASTGLTPRLAGSLVKRRRRDRR